MLLNRLLAPFRVQLVRSNERIFRGDAYQRINQRRLEHLATLGLPLSGKRVLELGAGIGDLSGFFLDCGCEMHVTDARHENVAYLQRRYPQVNASALDIEKPPTLSAEPFDIVFAYGLLYHLADPSAALRWMAEHCRGVLLLETVVSLGHAAELNPVHEQGDMASESFHSRGCRPTRAWVWQEMKKLFPHVHVPTTQPAHPEFPTLWRLKDGSTPKPGAHAARAVFIGSMQPLAGNNWLDELPDEQS